MYSQKLYKRFHYDKADTVRFEDIFSGIAVQLLLARVAILHGDLSRVRHGDHLRSRRAAAYFHLEFMRRYHLRYPEYAPAHRFIST